jgi:exopolysaccharide biosynthesis polyprenyl glycosylphosphotransferase
MLAPDQRRDSVGEPTTEPRPEGGRFRSFASSAIRRRQDDSDHPAARLLVVGGELEADGGASGAVEHVSLSLVGDGATVESAPLTIVPPRSRAAQRRPLLRTGLLTADGVAALTGVITAEALFDVSSSGAVATIIAVAIAGWWATAALFGLYSGNDVRTWASGVSQAPRLIVTALLLSWPLYATASALDVSAPAGAALVTVAATVTASGVLRGLVRAALHRGNHLRQRTLIIGSGEIAGDLVHKMRTQTHFGLDPIGFVDDDPHQAESNYVAYCGSLGELGDVLERHAVDRVIIAFTRASHETLLRCIRTCRDRAVATDIVPRLFELLDGAPGMAQIGGLPLISITVPRLSPMAGAVKRALDIVVTAIFLVTVLPMIVVIAIAIKLETPGPVLFRQERMGRGGRIFDVLKFRSMYMDAEERKRELLELNDLDDGVMFKIHEDPRITRVGRFLRRYSLDELPQFFNVLRGEMSLVGPRPLILDESDVLLEDWHGRRLDLRPGMTGPWQVLGRSDLTVGDMVRFDYAYVSGWSLARDFEILLATVPAVLSGRGAY